MPHQPCTSPDNCAGVGKDQLAAPNGVIYKKKSHRDKEPTAREILRTEESKPRGRKLEISVQTSLEKKNSPWRRGSREPTAREILRTEESKPRGRKLEISVQTSLEKKR
jgi:hypothetical protein